MKSTMNNTAIYTLTLTTGETRTFESEVNARCYACFCDVRSFTVTFPNGDTYALSL